MMEKRWATKPFDEKTAQTLSEALQVRKLYGNLLVQRGINTFEEARGFFCPTDADLHDPSGMKDMDKAVSRITEAVSRGEKILVYGDYDVDGTSAVALVFSFLREHHADIDYYIPHRHREGYGISIRGIDHAGETGVALMIVLDCGIKAVSQVRYARSLGIDMIICDHHLPGEGALPAASAILNPKQPGCVYPYKELSGCGIGYKLVTALAKSWNLSTGGSQPYLQLVALSIAADIVPLTGENRILTHLGLAALNTGPLPGLNALVSLCRNQEEQTLPLTVKDLAFLIAPRINAAGRMDEASRAVSLLIERDPQAARRYALQLHEDNSSRKELDKNITKEALAIIREEQPARNATLVYQPHWHKGVIGIVAARLMETYYRPTIVLTRSGELLSGSARSVSGFNIYEVLQECGALLENFGGHFYAAGMTLKPEHLDAFSEKFESVVASRIKPSQRIPEIRIDALIRLQDIQPKFFELLRRFEPFGPGNTEPVFMASGVRDLGRSAIVKMDHIRFEIAGGDSAAFTGIGFNLASKFDIVASGSPFDICFLIQKNTWKGRSSLQLRVLDIRAGILPNGQR